MMSNQKRIIQELEIILCNPIENVTFWIDPINLKKWYFILSGLGSPYTDGQYICQMEISDKFPYEAPIFRMETPNGRFHPGQPLCINDFSEHPERWKYDWTLESIIRAFIAYFMSICHKGHNVGNNIIALKADKVGLAKKSKLYNLTYHQPLLDKIKNNQEITIIG